MVKTHITPNTCQYINVSSLKEISPAASALIAAFHKYEKNYGIYRDLNKAMLDIPAFLYTLTKVVDKNVGITAWHGHHTDGYDDIADALQEHIKNVYIDLEN